MNKKIIALLSFVLSLAIIMSCVTVAAYGEKADTTADTVEDAASLLLSEMEDARQGDVHTLGADGKCSCGYDPIVVLPGINHSKAYWADENGNPKTNSKGEVIEGNNVIIDTESLIPYAIKEAVIPLVSTIITQRDCGLSDAFGKVSKEAFKIQAADNEGNTYENIDIYRYKSMATVSEEDYRWLNIMVPMQGLIDVVGADHVYFFTFNLAGDPMASVDELDEYIQTVKAETGHDKVNLLSVSLGGTIFTAYAEKYGDKNDISCAVNAVAVLNGTNIFNDFMSRSWNLSDEFLYSDYFPIVMEESGSKAYGYLINIALRLLPKQVLMDCLTQFYEGLHGNLLSKIPQFWALVSSDAYPELADKYLSGDEYAVLRAKTDSFQQARLNLEQNMKDMMANGTRIHNICGYNLAVGDVQYSFFKIVESAESVNGDAIIPIESTSAGATAAQVNKQLEGVDLSSKYVSPDGEVDLSTCALPDNTWLFVNMHHENAGNNAATMNLICEMLINDDFEDTSYNPEKYPQFNYGTNNKRLRRWVLPDAKAVDQSTLSEEDKAELNAAIAQGDDVLAATIGNQADVDAAKTRLDNILIKIGVYEEPEQESVFSSIFEKICKLASDTVYKKVGPKGFSDK